MNLQRIECFLMVAQHKSFSQAASDLFMAQSSVTGQIKKLEEEVGFQVLERPTLTEVYSDSWSGFAGSMASRWPPW